jgi:hypothetical protein
MDVDEAQNTEIEPGGVAGEISDEELTRLALAADPDPRLDDAVPLWQLLGGSHDPPLPHWYMPAPMTGPRRVRGWRRRAIVLVVVSFLAIDAYGLCNTYGDLAPHSSDAPAQVAPAAP